MTLDGSGNISNRRRTAVLRAACAASGSSLPCRTAAVIILWKWAAPRTQSSGVRLSRLAALATCRTCSRNFSAHKQEELQTIQEKRTQEIPAGVTASQQLPAARVDDHGLTQLKHAEMARKRLEALPANDAYIVAKFLSSLPPPPEQLARATPSGTVTAANIQQQCKQVTRTVGTQTCVSALDASTQAGEPQLETHKATRSENKTDDVRQPNPPQQLVETQLLSAAYEAGQMVQMVHEDTLDVNALSPAAAALLPALMGNLQSALPRLATLMNWLSVMQADGHMVRSQEHGHYTVLHSTFHETEHLAVGNWILSYTAVLLASGIETRFGTDGAFGSFIEAWLVQLQQEPDPQWTQVALAFKECASTLHRALAPANQSRELYDRFCWKAGRNSCWETLHKMAGGRLDGNLLTWTAEPEHHSPVGVAFSSLPMQVLTFTQEEAIDSPVESDREVHKTEPRPVSPSESWPRLCDSESPLTIAQSPTRKGGRSPLPDGSAKQKAQAKSVAHQAACPTLCCICETLMSNGPSHVCPGNTGRRWRLCSSQLRRGQHRKEKRP